ncbi:uncharacterized protein si:dkeyp-118a3.2 [Myxocyprinus asiaticus]|uniref:uncharacterized protein si:dkeyp-118a3.2 n=1 Tax=Myxocyprinus asiaticus TaxID=70543 RepID=UPI002221614C|nr:uncharacterized protein si:dkeyp-118a3.2 [Myxocyprinus asiaticus]
MEREAQVQKPQLSEVEEKTAEGKIEEVEGIIDGEELKGSQVEEPAESEPSPEERPAVAAEEGTDGGVVVEKEEVEWEEQEQGAADFGGGVIEIEAGREKVEAGTEAQLQKVFRKVEIPPTNNTEPVETQKKPGRTHEANDVNEIIASRDQNDQGEPAMRNTVEELPPTPILGLGLGDTKEPVETHDDSTQSKFLGQEAWKIGAIAAAFFLILQTAITIVYILKCRRKTNRNAVDDLPEYSQVQQEDVAMTTIPLDSETNLSHDLRTSVV